MVSDNCEQVELLFGEVGGRARVGYDVGAVHQKCLLEFIDAVFNVCVCFWRLPIRLNV